LFDIDGFGQDQICANTKRLGHPCLTLYNRNRKRCLVRRRIPCALEQQGGILLVIAVHHNSVKVLAHQLLDCSERLDAGLDGKLKLAQNLRHCASSLVIGTEEKSLVTHRSTVGTPVRAIKLRW
jgi:hypothetical protein